MFEYDIDRLIIYHKVLLFEDEKQIRQTFFDR